MNELYEGCGYTYSNDGPECPYCSHIHKPDDAYYYEEDGSEIQCHSCEKVFRFTCGKIFSWNSYPKETPAN